MIWLAWRRRRGAVIATGVALAVVGALMVVTGSSMWSAFRGEGLASCIDGLHGARFVPAAGGCQDQAQAFAARYFNLRLLGLVSFTFLPLVIGMAWGAPAIARDLEDDTTSLVWTQGVSRRRWAWTQLAFAVGVAALTMGALAALITWWYGPLNAATGDRFQWLIFDQQGVVPVGYAIFATACAAFIGAVTGRTVRAMAIVAVVFIVTRFSVAVWWRPRFMAGMERTYPVVTSRVPNRLLNDWLYGGGGPGVGVVLRANGERVGGGQRICPPVDTACFADVGRDAINLELFHPASRFWTFQSIEAGIFLAFALALTVATVWWVRRRLV